MSVREGSQLCSTCWLAELSFLLPFETAIMPFRYRGVRRLLVPGPALLCGLLAQPVIAFTGTFGSAEFPCNPNATPLQ